MATNSFKSRVSSGVGTTFTSIYTTPASKSTIMIGLNLACVVTSSITANVQIVKSGGSTVYLIKSIPIPTGASFEVLSGQKIVLETGDQVQVNCNTASGMDVIMNFLDITS